MVCKDDEACAGTRRARRNNLSGTITVLKEWLFLPNPPRLLRRQRKLGLRLRSAENNSFEILKQPDPLVGSSLDQH